MKNFLVLFIIMFLFSFLFSGILLLGQERVKYPKQIIVFEEEQTKKEEPKNQVRVGEEQTAAEEVKTEKQLPEDFEEVLARYGEWVETKEYGLVWIPYDNQKEDWRPYTRGRWQEADYRGTCNYWFSYEPFGFIVYHFGYWQWSSLYGWYWIPGYVWAPAWVYWYSWGNWIYWVPMPMRYSPSYYNRYYYLYSSSSRVWTGVRKNNLKNPNIWYNLRTQRAAPAVNIASSRITKNVPTAPTKVSSRTSRSIARTPNRSVQNQKAPHHQPSASPLRMSSPNIRPSSSSFSRSFSRIPSPSISRIASPSSFRGSIRKR